MNGGVHCLEIYGFLSLSKRLARSRVEGDGPSMVEPEEDADIPAAEVARRYAILYTHCCIILPDMM